MNFIFTGCAGAGKTTLINHLSMLGYTCYEEVSRKIIKEQLHQQSNAVPWKDTVAFCHLTFQRMLENMPTNSNKVCFLDRGLPDLIAYLTAVRHPIPQIYYQALRQAHYASTAFLFPPNKRIYINDNERQETFEQAVCFFKAIKETYGALGFRLIVVPFGSVEQRAITVQNRCIPFIQNNII